MLSLAAFVLHSDDRTGTMAKAAANANPYAVPGELTDAPVYAMPNSAYAVPAENEENGTMDSPFGAYSPVLRAQPGGTPDPMRTGRLAVRDFRPDPSRPPEQFFDRLDADDKQRHSVEFQDADGMEEFKAGSGKPTAIDPRRHPQPEPRPSMRLMPRSYVFTRPEFGGPRALTGEHFSMADHRRDYPILGTQPVRTWRNTYRIQPMPWDADMLDMPPNDPTDVIGARIQSVEVPLSRGWRL
jgi:hypothetical protein